MGLSKAEFWEATPREVRALFDRVAERERRQDARFGVLAEILANANRDPKRRPEPFTADLFFPSLSDGPMRAGASHRATDQQVQAGWEAWAAMCRAG